MAYDENVARRIRGVLEGRPGIVERKMFGGLAFLSHGHMFVGVLGPALVARVGPDEYTRALHQPHVREMDFTGRPLKGYVYIDPAGFAAAADLGLWVNRSLAFVASLPPKLPK